MENGDNHEKYIIVLTLSDLELHHIDLDRSSKQDLKELQNVFGAKGVNVKLFIELHLFKFNMARKTTVSSHINELKSIVNNFTSWCSTRQRQLKSYVIK